MAEVRESLEIQASLTISHRRYGLISSNMFLVANLCESGKGRSVFALQVYARLGEE
jgi:hypothetical protein